MKKEFTLTLVLQNASDIAVDELTKKATELFDEVEYLSPKLDVEITYRHEN